LAGILSLVLLSATGSARAEQKADEMIRATVDQVIMEITNRRAELEADHGALYALVDNIIVPQIAMDKVARLILGDHWKSASDQQRERFSDSFKNLIIRSYATAMFQYTGEQELRYGEVTLRGEGRIAVVATTLAIPGEAPVPVDYYCLKASDGRWQIYDIQIDGISLIISYRNQYGEFIANNGLDALISSLEEKAMKAGKAG
jgi:phospholipid transport system substrate-binding protein